MEQGANHTAAGHARPTAHKHAHVAMDNLLYTSGKRGGGTIAHCIGACGKRRHTAARRTTYSASVSASVVLYVRYMHDCHMASKLTQNKLQV